MDESKQTVYVSGATGMIGKSLVQYAAPEGKPAINWIPIPRAELERDPITFEFAPGSHIVHLAARVHAMNEPKEGALDRHRLVNRDMTLRLARRAIECGVSKFIFASTIKVFGSFRGALPSNADPKPGDPYGQSKREAELGLLELFNSQTQSQLVILRFPLVYGPGNKGNLAALLGMASRKIPLPLAWVRGKRSMIYVGNVIDAIVTILAAQKSRPSGVYQIRDAVDLTSGELYSLIFQEWWGRKGVFPFPEFLLRAGGMMGTLGERVLGRSLPLSNAVVSRLFDEFRFSSQPFETDYQWRQPFGPEVGVRDLMKWYREGV